METQSQDDLCLGVHLNRLNINRIPAIKVLILNDPVALVFQPNNNVVLNQGIGNPPEDQNLNEAVSPNAYIDQVLAEL